MRIEQVQAVVAAGAMMAGGAAVQAQTAVQWRVEDGGNGHWYAVMRAPTPVLQEDAETLASTFGGNLMSACGMEFDFAVNHTSALHQSVWVGQAGPWIGLSRRSSLGWQWTDGSTCSFDRWASGQPNGGDDVVSLLWADAVGDGPQAACHDHFNQAWTPYFLIEWSADCNNDGIVDYGQIRAGALSDQNGNNIPDGCECAAHPELAACCVGDLYVDQRVDGADLAALLSHWGQTSAGGTPEDLNRDGSVDGNDLGILLAHWGPCGQ